MQLRHWHRYSCVLTGWKAESWSGGEAVDKMSWGTEVLV